MIIISSGLPKSGSTLICNCQEEIVTRFSKNGQEMFKKMFEGRFVSNFNWIITLKLVYINLRYGSIVVKTHSEPNLYIKLLITFGLAKASFTIRDPRDIVLSAMDHGKRNVDINPFNEYSSFDVALNKVLGYNSLFQKWKSFGQVHIIRYEDSISDLEKVILVMLSHFNMPLEKKVIESVVFEIEANKKKAWNFNKGEKERFSSELNSEDIQESNQRLSRFLIDMDYKI